MQNEKSLGEKFVFRLKGIEGKATIDENYFVFENIRIPSTFFIKNISWKNFTDKFSLTVSENELYEFEYVPFNDKKSISGERAIFLKRINQVYQKIKSNEKLKYQEKEETGGKEEKNDVAEDVRVENVEEKEESLEISENKKEEPVVQNNLPIIEENKEEEKYEYIEYKVFEFGGIKMRKYDVHVKKILSISVTDIQKKQNYSIYKLITKYITENGSNEQLEVFHRYNDMNDFNNKLVNIHTIARLKCKLPEFPQKSLWDYVSDKEGARLNKFNTYFPEILSQQELLDNPKIFKLLVDFIRQGEDSGEKINRRKWIKVLTPEEEWIELLNDMKYYGISPTSVPWQKYVVSIFGITSAGKSSLTNNLFTIPIKSVASHQQDTVFSIIEVVSEIEFKKYLKNDRAQFPNFTNEDLMANIPNSEHMVKIDPRYDTVFLYLDTLATLNRYKSQLYYFDSYSQDKNIYTILINEKYLRGSKQDIELAKSIIIIDSKGLDQASNFMDSQNEGAFDNFIMETKTMSYIINSSNQVLFLAPAQNVRLIGNQLKSFEFSIRGLDFIENFDREYKLQKEKASAPPLPQNTQKEESSNINMIKNITNNFYDTLVQEGVKLGTSVIQESTKVVSQMFYDYVQKYTKKEKKQQFPVSNILWKKVTFIITKIDTVLNEKKDLSSIFYELGCTLGRSLMTEHPTVNSWVMIGLPERSRVKEITGDLTKFKSSLAKIASNHIFSKSLDECIITCCDLLSASEDNQSIMSYIYNKKETYKTMKIRAQNRLKDLNK